MALQIFSVILEKMKNENQLQLFNFLTGNQITLTF